MSGVLYQTSSDCGGSVALIDLNVVNRSLRATGVVLFPNAATCVEAVEELTKAWFSRFHQPATRVAARAANDDGYTSRISGSGYLLGHAEGYYRPCLPPPDVCVFWCECAPTVSGGETTWIDGVALFAALPTELRNRLVAEPIVYESIWPRDRWQAEFGVHGLTELRRCLDSDSRCKYDIEEGKQLRLFFETPAVISGPAGAPAFINGLLAHLPELSYPRYEGNVYCKPSNKIHWAGGGAVKTEEINAIVEAHDAVMNKHRWQDGDLLILDNHRVLHGRECMHEIGNRIIYSRFGYW